MRWIAVRLILILSLVLNWTTVQSDYKNAFAQPNLTDKVYMELPKDFSAKQNGDFVLWLNKSLYGLCQAPLIWYEHLKANLEQCGFVTSKVDSCLFINHQKQIFCLVYVDDVVWVVPSRVHIDKVLVSLKDDFELTVEGDIQTFWGIQFTQLQNGTIQLTQHGLIDCVLKATGMQDSNPDQTPASTKPLGLDKNGAPFKEQWSYASVVGMLLYLGANSHPEIAYAVHQCACFTHAPKDSHAKAVKRILHYLNGTKDQGIILHPSKQFSIDSFIDANFAGQWNAEDPHDPHCVQSRTGYSYILMVGNCPIHWKSKLQMETAVSTMEAEYVVLSTAMHDLIPLRTLVDKVQHLLDLATQMLPCTTYLTIFEDNNGALILATSPCMTPQSKHIAVKYHFFKEYVHCSNGTIKITKVRLDKVLFHHARKMLGGW